MSDDLVCLVCGDRALGKNFGAVTCESCKAFFRRNAHKIKLFVCSFNNKCQLDSITRRFCRTCRLTKCFDIGMKEDWILNDLEREERRLKIESRRLKRKRSQSNDISHKSSKSTVSSSPEACITSTGDDSPDTSNSTLILCNSSGAEDSPNNCQQMSAKVFDPHYKVTDNACQSVVEFDFAVIPIARPITDYNNNFNENEFLRLQELLSATNHMQRNFIPVATEEPKQFNDFLNCLLRKCENDIPVIVKMCKSLRGFNTICGSDQISLLKLGALEVILFRIMVTFDRNTNCYIVVEDNKSTRLSLEFWKCSSEARKYTGHSNWINKMFSQWDGDPIILDLLTAILLFNPNRPNLQHVEAIKLQRHCYMHLLNRYLLLKYRSDCEAKTRLLFFMSNFDDIHDLSVRHATSFMRGYPNLPNPFPLLKEICDINTTNTSKNFGAVSCESCKAFFRRNAHKKDSIWCHFNSNCRIDPITRRFCKFCRLKKCFVVGMKESWILSDEEKEERRLKIATNRQKLSQRHKAINTDGSPQIASDTSSDSHLTQQSDPSAEQPDDLSLDISDDLIKIIADIDLDDIPIERSIAENHKQLNDNELGRLQEVITACNHSLLDLIPVATSEATDFYEFIGCLRNKGETEIPLIVRMCRHLRAFDTLCGDDQISLLKFGALEMLIQRLICTYDSATKCFIIPQGDKSTKLSLEFWRFQERKYTAYMNLLSTMSSKWDGDPLVIHLLTIILLFNPDRPNLTHKDTIK
ncbi:unnamed protein product [Oppiella nova]|uniref:Uncharacterized protein n=1 Tax=Oppiella nova TaxID=334625 RepID=A0A7R9M1D0_9ACAR|nr:unnamed protein product [Oppiella nova]CAG2168938.1 unnamed protein product [Oppiella nova]